MNSAYNRPLLNKRSFNNIRWIIIFFSILYLYIPLSHGEEPLFSISLSTFNNEQDAQKEESKLKKSGHNAFYRKENGPDNNSNIYHVYIEKYNSRDEAEAEAKVLKNLELISDYTISEIKEIPQIITNEGTQPAEKIPEVSHASLPTETKEQAPEPEPIDAEQTPKPETKTSETTTQSDEPPAINKPAPSKTENIINKENDQFTGASLQIGAFKDEANAAVTKIQLKKLGKNAFYRKEATDSEGVLYRLYITGYKSLKEAISDAKKLVESGVISGYSRVSVKGSLSNLPPEKKTEKVEKGEVYFIHISSNKDEATAAEAVAKLKNYGCKAFYVHETDLSENWYRVYIGKFKNEAEARNNGLELLEKGIISYFKPLAIDLKKLGN